jgi:hypothetical protein
MKRCIFEVVRMEGLVYVMEEKWKAKYPLPNARQVF